MLVSISVMVQSRKLQMEAHLEQDIGYRNFSWVET